MSTGTLRGVSSPQLEQLLNLVVSGKVGVPLRAVTFQAQGIAPVWNEVAWLSDLDRQGLEAVLRVAIAERSARTGARLELVWTGPEAKVSSARDTAVVVRELFSRARQSVIVAGFSFTTGARIFEPLHAAMRDHQVEAHILLHINDTPGLAAEHSATEGVESFLHDNWPFGPPLPRLYYDPRTVAPGSSINLHAKCIVVDTHWALVGSANFTHSAQYRNIEAGVLIEDATFATALAQQWFGLISSGLVRQA